MPPEVIDGQRDHNARPASPSMLNMDALLRPATNFVVFHSRYRFLKLELSAKKDSFVNGEMITAENPRIQFDDYALRFHAKDDADLIARLRRHKLFGLDGYFWEPAMREEYLAEQQVDDTLARMADPKFVEALKRRAGSKDFDLADKIGKLVGKAITTPIAPSDPAAQGQVTEKPGRKVKVAAAEEEE